MDRKFMAGVRATLPVCLGVIPVGMSFGLLAVQAGMTGGQSVLMSALVFAGAAQLMAVNLISRGAAVGTIILATFFINLRHIVMSSSVMTRLRDTPLWKRLLGAYVLCDETFAVFSLSEEQSIEFLFGANAAIYVTWMLSNVVGCALNQVLPELVTKSFAIAFYAAFLGMLLPSVRGRRRLVLLAALTAALNFLLQLVLPASWAVICSMILGAAAGTFFVEEGDLA